MKHLSEAAKAAVKPFIWMTEHQPSVMSCVWISATVTVAVRVLLAAVTGR